ncbi:MAG TPA: hypothetical protein VF627_01615 [Abditibacterium sp.]|jgi:hypothetical protein
MKRFGYENPYAPPPPRLRPAGWLLLLILGLWGLSRVDAPWNPLQNPRLHAVLPPFVARHLPRPKVEPRVATQTQTKHQPEQTSRPAIEPRTTPSIKPAPLATPKPPVSNSNLPLKLPGKPVVFERRDAKTAELEAKMARFPAFKFYKALAERHLELGNNAAAARTLRTEAKLFQAKGLSEAATVLQNRAARYETTVRVFAPSTNDETRDLAPLEPRNGCYLGAFIDRDDALSQRFSGDNWQYHHLPSEFERITGRRHASVFTYVAWGNFPRAWLQMCKREGVIPHIAWEPKNLNDVKNDAYLRGCAEFLRDLNWPVFVRFAGEMNGDWTPYHGNPALYREKFRLVHRVLHQAAPKVATIWCVNAIPADNIEPYYPGDDGCDWVGVNLYSTPFADNDRTRAAFQDSPLTLLEPIYRRFSARKPIAICEYAASHRAAVDGVTRIEFAREKMALLYGALPLLYPRVKLIDWFSSDNLRHAREGRQLNNYRLTEHEALLQTYRELTQSAHFLTSPNARGASNSNWREVESKLQNRQIALWVTSYVGQPKVFVRQNGRVVYAAKRTGAHLVSLPNSGGPLEVVVYDSQNRCAAVERLS